jgi:hypothetical protein
MSPELADGVVALMWQCRSVLELDVLAHVVCARPMNPVVRETLDDAYWGVLTILEGGGSW